jgi:hypothetical protein
MARERMRVRWSRSPALVLGALAVFSYSTPYGVRAVGESECGQTAMMIHGTDGAPETPAVHGRESQDRCNHCTIDVCALCDYTTVAAAVDPVIHFSLAARAHRGVPTNLGRPWTTTKPPTPPPQAIA